jgi:anti-sigma regulatory factor (Ser/Thr protein kinase)
MAQRVELAPPLHHRIRTPRGASVVLSVPAHKDYVVIIRSAVAQLGACFGYTVREVADLRLAVNEACGLLVAGTRGSAFAVGTIECRAEVRGDVLRVTVAAPAGGFDAPDTDGLGWNIMTVLVDALAWAQDGVTARVDLEKRRGIRAQENDLCAQGSPGG